MISELVRQRLKEVPERPGCYLMRDRRGVIIYIGKAVNLRRRVSSYFRAGARHPPKVRSMVDTVYDFEFMTVKNDAEALLTEASLIKKYKPHFNILMRDDKRYLALRADVAAEVPRFSCVRVVKDDGARYSGPFPSSPVVRAAKDFAEKRYGIRSCRCECPDAEAHRHCSADVIRNCSAPCLGKISPEEYRARFAEACEFLDGKCPAVIAEVGEAMKAASEKGDYEAAAKLRDTFLALKEMTKHNFVRHSPEMQKENALKGLAELAEAIGLERPPHWIECYDISNLFGTHSVASLVVARDGLPDKRYYRHFKIKTIIGADDPRSMAEVITRRFTHDEKRLSPEAEVENGGETFKRSDVRSQPQPSASTFSVRPDLIICDGGVTQLRATRAALASLGLSDIPTVGLAERQEEIVLDPETISSTVPLHLISPPQSLLLPRDSQALFVCTRLRDEAHRFAITFHRKLRDKDLRDRLKV